MLLIQSLNKELYNINNWIITIRLSLNIAKSNFIIFYSPKKVILYDSPPSINNIDLIRVTSFRYLGIILDEHLSWLDHIKHIQGRIVRNIGIIARIRPFVSTKTALLLYFSLFYPYLTYCNIVWASTYHTRLNQLFILQKHVIRIIFSLPILSHTNSTFINNNLLNLQEIHSLQTALVMFSYNKNALPDKFVGLMSKSVNYTKPSYP